MKKTLTINTYFIKRTLVVLVLILISRAIQAELFNVKISVYGPGYLDLGEYPSAYSITSGNSKEFQAKDGTELYFHLYARGNYLKYIIINNEIVLSNFYSVYDFPYYITITKDTEITFIFEFGHEFIIKSSGGGSVYFEGTTISNSASEFHVMEGESATVTFSGSRLKSVKENGTDVTPFVKDNKYTINNISNVRHYTTLEVEFDAIDVGTKSSPINVATAIEYIKTLGNDKESADQIYVKGKVSHLTDQFNTQYGDASFYISDDGLRSNELLAFRVLYLDNQRYDGKGQLIMEGDDVVICGNVINYQGTTPGTVQNKAYLYSLNGKTEDNPPNTPHNDEDKEEGTETNPFTCAAANAFASSLPSYAESDRDIYIAGKVVAIKEQYGTQFGNATFWISDDGTTTDQFYVFRALYLGNEKYTSGDLLQKGDDVVICGRVTNYMGNTPETAQGKAWLVSMKHNEGGDTPGGDTSGGEVNGNTITVDFPSMGYDNAQDVTSVTLIDGTTLTFGAGTNRNAPKYYNSGTAIRMFPSNTLTVRAASGKTLASIALNCSANNAEGNVTASPGTVAVNDMDVTVSGINAGSTTITNTHMGTGAASQLRIGKMVITYAEPVVSQTCILTVKATGNGFASYNGTTIRNKATTFSVNEGTNATISFSPDNGYRIKSVMVGNSDITASVSNNRYTVSNIQSNTTVAVEFESIPTTTYTLTIKAEGNGVAGYNGINVRGGNRSFTIDKGSSVVVSFTPDNGFHIEIVKVNETDVTNSIVNGQYTINNILSDTRVEVVFTEIIKEFSSQGVNYTVTSYEEKTVCVANGNYGKVLEVPASMEYQDDVWTIKGINKDALDRSNQLAAIIWNANAPFTATTSNPNLLLYVTDSKYAPSTVNNVVVNGTAESIILAEADSGNNFYCPQEFTARSISYAHNYTMTTGIGEARGWETLALPFDVQQVKHENKGELTPFANWKSGNEVKPFWLMELSSSGWRETDRIMANTPYIVSMPNNEKYKEEFLLNGKVTFSAENATVRKSEDVKTVQYEGRTFIPTFSEIGEGGGAYALNVSNDYETNVSGVADGSRFVLNLRRIHPFEAYMQSSTKTRAFDISDGMGIVTNNEKLMIKVYNLKGQMMKSTTNASGDARAPQSMEEMKKSLPAGIYIINGKKMIVN